MCSPRRARLNDRRGHFHTYLLKRYRQNTGKPSVVGKLVWVHCLEFFKPNLLKRYRQNTGETRGGALNLGFGGVACFKMFPQILVYVNAHWYQFVALGKLVWMHCVDFFIRNLLKRYRQNTGKTQGGDSTWVSGFPSILPTSLQQTKYGKIHAVHSNELA